MGDVLGIELNNLLILVFLLFGVILFSYKHVCVEAVL
jgi:hypothetical protein